MVWTYRSLGRRLGHIIVAAGAAAIASGCLPQQDAKKERAQPHPATKTGKSDPVRAVVVVTAADRAGSALAADGAREAPLITSATVAMPRQDLAAPEEKIDDTPANIALERFFRSLAALGKDGSGRPVTILHLGDSHIAADRLSGDLREEFQKRFGDAGRGMLMPGIYLARGARFEQNGQWQTSLSTDGAAGPYGVTGAKLTGKERDAWLRLTATGERFTWCEIALESSRDAGSVLIGVDGDLKVFPAASGPQGVRTVRIDKPGHEILIKPKGDGPIALHSIAIGTTKPGVRYVNFGLPGATAATPLSWDAAYLASDVKRLAPDLIVLSYGTEEAFNDNLDLGEYEAKAAATISRLRQSAPQASFLIVGPPDVARLPDFAASVSRSGDVCRALSPKDRLAYPRMLKKHDLRIAHWHPPLRLDGVRTALRRLAAANQAYFWDWSKLMGGTCGIHAWVHQDPPLAAANHVYLTDEGSKRSAKALFRELMMAYDAFERAVAGTAAPQRGK